NGMGPMDLSGRQRRNGGAVGVVAAVAAFAGGLAWGRRQRRVDAIVRRTCASVISADSQAAVDAAVAEAVARLRTSHAAATGVGLGELAHRHPASMVDDHSTSALVEQATDAILVVDDANRVRFASPSARVLFGTAMLHDRNFLDFVDPDERGLAEHFLG